MIVGFCGTWDDWLFDSWEPEVPVEFVPEGVHRYDSGYGEVQVSPRGTRSARQHGPSSQGSQEHSNVGSLLAFGSYLTRSRRIPISNRPVNVRPD